MLREHGIEPDIVRYLEDPPDEETLAGLIAAMGMKPRELLRKREKEFEQLGLSDPSKSDAEIIEAMVSHPRLIERPIVVGPKGTVLGRPTERVLEVV